MGILEIVIFVIIGLGVCTAVAWAGFAVFEQTLGTDRKDGLSERERQELETLRAQNQMLRDRMANVERRLPPPPPPGGPRATGAGGTLADQLDREDAYRSLPSPPPAAAEEE